MDDLLMAAKTLRIALRRYGYPMSEALLPHVSFEARDLHRATALLGRVLDRLESPLQDKTT